jgi:methionyl-tRNA synthetase
MGDAPLRRALRRQPFFNATNINLFKGQDPMGDTFFITTAIDYTNGAPHIGHAYEKVLADVIARARRLQGGDAFFLTGVDQHGQKVQQSAEKKGVEPQRFVDEITAKFVALWKKLGVEYNEWAATTAPRHKECVRAILQRLWDDRNPATGESRWLYKKTERGWYSIRQEQFITDKERGPDGEFGPEWQPVEEREEENFYFRLKEHKPWLSDYVRGRADFVTPSFRQSELLNAVEKIEGDLCISRPASRLKWGIPFPESWGAGFVTYVWFDALVNYISFSGFNPNSKTQHPKFSSLWPALHVIGKDILIPAHGVYWPVMLHALDLDMPALLVHGWWNIAGAKMSKSTGHIADPDALADRYGAEALRYYLMSDIATGKDADFSEKRLVQRYNVDLANSLGNLLNRSLNMAQKYRGGKLACADRDAARLEWPKDVLPAYEKAMRAFDIHEALAALGSLAVHCNAVVEKTAPWTLAKQEQQDPAKAAQLDAVLYHLAESLRIIAILLSPVLPNAAHGIFDQLQWKPAESGRESRFQLADAAWGGLPDGHVVGKPVPLFPRIEPPKAG